MRQPVRPGPKVPPAPNAPPRRRRCRAGGFSFIEALAALLLIALVVPVAIRGVSLAAAAGGRAAERAEAMQLADMKLQELVATGAWRDGRLQGDFSRSPSGELMQGLDAAPRTERFQWEVQLVPWMEASLQELTLRVWWTSGTQERQVVLSTLVATER